MRALVHDRYGPPDVVRLEAVGRADALAGVDSSSGDPGRTPLSLLARSPAGGQSLGSKVSPVSAGHK